MRWTWLTMCLLLAVGCSGGKQTGNADERSPVTEEEVKTAVTQMVNNNQGYYRAKVKSIELLSALLELPEQFLQKNSRYDAQARACYVLITCEPLAGQPKGGQFTTLVVVRREGGQPKAPINIMDVPIIKENFGEEWYAKHPRPTP